MLTGTAKRTAKDQDSTAENRVSGQMFSTENTVDRICVICFPLNLISVAPKHNEILSPRKHIS